MRVLFAHQNFPGQFRHLAAELVRQKAQVHGLTMNEPTAEIAGVTTSRSTALVGSKSEHAWARDFEAKIIRAETTLQTALKLRRDGFSPDVIIGHPGWGDTLFLKDVWPDARLGIYCEFFYAARNTDHDFDPEFAVPLDDVVNQCRYKLRALPQRLHFGMANAGISPTYFQADTYPQPFRDRITVVHDGIDTSRTGPQPNAALTFGSGLKLTGADEVVTFVSRSLEPYRGYHIFMRALPKLMRERPNAHVVIVGDDGVSYGAKPKSGSWRDQFMNEVGASLDMSRIHFVGKVPYAVFLQLLAVSSVHVYLTYPFVLSWSLLEAMSSGTAIVASDTGPLQEVVKHGETGLLFPFFDPDALANAVSELLADAPRREKLAKSGRDHVIANYDLKTVCLPRQLEWVDQLFNQDPLPPFI